MKTKAKTIFILSEINLILWIAVLVMFHMKELKLEKYVMPGLVTGFVFSMVLQHWAYHKIYKNIKKTTEPNAGEE